MPFLAPIFNNADLLFTLVVNIRKEPHSLYRTEAVLDGPQFSNS